MYAVTQPRLYEKDPQDYGLVYSFGLRHRGPCIDPDLPYVCCLGNSLTFGRHVGRPYPSLLGRQAINLGFQHLNPTNAMKNGCLMKWARRASYLVMQFRHDELRQAAALATILGVPAVLLNFVGPDGEPYDGAANVPFSPVEGFYVDQAGHEMAARFLRERLC